MIVGGRQTCATFWLLPDDAIRLALTQEIAIRKDQSHMRR
jgi:hypothetical protein